ncbi:MAG TPA: phosphoadenylyl-sulfate reductase [Limnochordales bacterium]
MGDSPGETVRDETGQTGKPQEPPDPGFLSRLADRMEREQWPAEAIVGWAVGTFGEQACLACSFGVEDMVLLHMASALLPGMHVFYLDTGLLFEETYRLVQEVQGRYPIRLLPVRPALSLPQQARRLHPRLWEVAPDLCCHLRKVQPLEQFLRGYRAWITGIRREQSPTRAGARPVEWDQRFALVKVNPLVGWSWQQVWAYVRRHRVPHNPLHHQGYPSLGCRPCTSPVEPGEHARAGRWRGHEKTECGLHVSQPGRGGNNLRGFAGCGLPKLRPDGGGEPGGPWPEAEPAAGAGCCPQPEPVQVRGGQRAGRANPPERLLG